MTTTIDRQATFYDIDKSFRTGLKDQLLNTFDHISTNEARALVFESYMVFKLKIDDDELPEAMQKQVDWYCSYDKESISLRLKSIPRMVEHFEKRFPN